VVQNQADLENNAGKVDLKNFQIKKRLLFQNLNKKINLLKNTYYF